MSPAAAARGPQDFLVQAGAASSFVTFAVLSPGVAYTTRVSAINAAGRSTPATAGRRSPDTSPAPPTPGATAALQIVTSQLLGANLRAATMTLPHPGTWSFAVVARNAHGGSALSSASNPVSAR